MGRNRRGIWLLALGSLCLIPGLYVFVTDPGAVTPAFLLGTLLIVIGLFVRGRSPEPGAAPPPPRPDVPD